MRLIEIENIKDNHILAKNIYDTDGRILLKKGSRIQATFEKRLRYLDIPYVYVEDGEFEKEIEHNEIVHDSVKLGIIQSVKEAYKRAEEGKSLNTKELLGAVGKLVEDIENADIRIISESGMVSKDMKKYIHCFNVAMMAIMMALQMRYNKSQIREIAIGALLHNIGSAAKGDKDHSFAGFQILKDENEFNAKIAHVALQHHERADGQGAPRGLVDKDIFEYARIVSICCYYDLLTFMDDNPIYPYEALEIISAETGKRFSAEINQVFVRHIAPYPVGSFVKTNTGIYCIVAGVNVNFPSRPILIQVGDAAQRRITEARKIDMLDNMTLFITEILSEKQREEMGMA